MKKPVRFNEALDEAIKIIKACASDIPGARVFIVRDFFGRLHLGLEGNPETDSQAIEPLLVLWNQKLGAYAPAPSAQVFWRDEMFDPDAIFVSPDAQDLGDIGDGKSLFLIERQTMAKDWLRIPKSGETDADEFKPLGVPSVTFYGFKGGVGRSTALAAFAWWAAEKKGKKVLIIDLDLESPGISTNFIQRQNYWREPKKLFSYVDRTLPDYGVIDWLIEDAVGQADKTLLIDMVAPGPASNRGEIRVAPALGEKTERYIPKLGRVYADVRSATKGVEHFGERLLRMCNDLINQEKPDILLLDSRAGLHDIASVAITHLSSVALLFATSGAQSWMGYRELLSNWKSQPAQAKRIREKLKVVAALIPQTPEERLRYVENLTEASWSCFSEIYDPIEALSDDKDEADSPSSIEDQALSAFNFNRDHEDAPHWPLKVYWNPAYIDANFILQPELLSENQFNPAFGDFVEGLGALVGWET